jgi:hypothetical protein
MNDDDKPATKRDLREAIAEMHKFVLDREIGLMWKVIAVQVTLIGAISGGLWSAITFTLSHWKPTP